MRADAGLGFQPFKSPPTVTLLGEAQQYRCNALDKWHISSEVYFSLEQQVQQSKAKEHDLQEQLKEIQKLLTQSKLNAEVREAAAWRQALQELSNKYSPRCERLQKQTDSLYDSLKQANENSEAAAATHENIIKDLNAQLHNAYADVTSQRAQLIDQKQQIRKLQGELTLALDSVSRCEAAKEALQDQLEVAKQKRKTLYDAISRYERTGSLTGPSKKDSNDADQQLIDKLLKEVQQLVEDKSRMAAENARLIQQAVEASHQHKLLQAELAAVHVQLRKLETRWYQRYCCFFCCGWSRVKPDDDE